MELPYWFDENFDLGFEFPYFDTVLTTLNLNSSDIAYIDDSEEYNMYLFSKEYRLYPEFNILGNLESDYRYKQTVIDNKKVFIFEFKRVLFDHYPGEVKFKKSDISFQYWFWSDGTIEIRFGDIKFDNTVYIPGKGLKTNIDSIYFPFIIQILNFDVDEIITVSGDLNNDPEIIFSEDFEEESMGVTYVPAKNTVCRFKPKSVHTIDINILNQIDRSIFNITQLASDWIEQDFILYNYQGQIVHTSDKASLNVSHLPSGFYVAKSPKGITKRYYQP